jgi:hypothetical protein
MVDAAIRGLEKAGFSLTRVPGKGLSNVWDIEKKGETVRVAVRTTRDRWIAFPPLEGGKKWKTLDDVEGVVVASVDRKENPSRVEVYLLDVADVRRRFDAAYEARSAVGTVTDNFGMWVALDRDTRGIAASVGSGLIEGHKAIAEFELADLMANSEANDDAQDDNEAADSLGHDTIPDVLSYARSRIAQLAGCSPSAIKLDLKIEISG